MAPLIDNLCSTNTDPGAGPVPASHLEPGFPIAIIGINCNFAGGVKNPEKLWELCAQGGSAWSEIPKSRFNHDSFYDEDIGKLAMVSSAPILAKTVLERRNWVFC
jgi:hypothetical protein